MCFLLEDRAQRQSIVENLNLLGNNSENNFRKDYTENRNIIKSEGEDVVELDDAIEKIELLEKEDCRKKGTIIIKALRSQLEKYIACNAYILRYFKLDTFFANCQEVLKHSKFKSIIISSQKINCPDLLTKVQQILLGRLLYLNRTDIALYWPTGYLASLPSLVLVLIDIFNVFGFVKQHKFLHTGLRNHSFESEKQIDSERNDGFNFVDEKSSVNVLDVFSDADHNGDTRTGKSYSSYATFYNVSLIDHGCERVPSVTISPFETELFDVSRAKQHSEESGNIISEILYFNNYYCLQAL